MCGHHHNTDLISGRIEGFGHYQECDFQRKQWNQKLNKKVYIGVGVHTGACSMEFLLTTKARVVPYEPHPPKPI